jgi:hypothetical protein
MAEIQIKAVTPTVKIVVPVGVPGPAPTEEEILAALELLPRHDDVKAATDAGLVSGNPFIFTNVAEYGLPAPFIAIVP